MIKEVLDLVSKIDSFKSLSSSINFDQDSEDVQNLIKAAMSVVADIESLMKLL